MKIAVIGVGAMGELYGGYLSQHNQVVLLDTDKAKVDKICTDGICIKQAGEEKLFFPKAYITSCEIMPVDLIILFVKAMFSRDALDSCKNLIGPDTYVMTLQNGCGHEEVLKEFVKQDHIIIGTTQHNASLLQPGMVHHGGTGKTCIGLLTGDKKALRPIAESFTACGFETEISDNIQKLIWRKLFTNVSVSVLTGVLQVRMGFLQDSEHGWFLVRRLLEEAVAVANGDGMGFDQDLIIEEVKTLLTKAPNGYTSIYADLRDGRKTEVDTISGSVVRASKRNGVPAPSHAFIVEMVHALEDKVEIN